MCEFNSLVYGEFISTVKLSYSLPVKLKTFIYGNLTGMRLSTIVISCMKHWKFIVCHTPPNLHVLSTPSEFIEEEEVE